MKRALITGITGQDGSYLAELLLSKGYEVHGLVRSATGSEIFKNLSAIQSRLKLHYGDLGHAGSTTRLIHLVQPDEVYNLASQSQVKVSFDNPEYTVDAGTTGLVRLLEGIRQSKKPIRFYQASSSEMFGKVHHSPQNERTPFYPRSPYGCTKLFGHWAAVNYREAYGLHCSSGILFNHESPRRGETFVTRKITLAVARIKAGSQNELHLGNLDAKRDWGYAVEYVEAMWLMLQADYGGDYVVSTGETHSVKEFVETAFEYAGLDWKQYVKTDPAFHRPSEVDLLVGDSSKMEIVFGWKPKTKFKELVKLMVDADLEKI